MAYRKRLHQNTSNSFIISLWRTCSLITPKEQRNVASLVCLWGQRKEKQRNWVLLQCFLPAVSLHSPSAMHVEGGGSLSSIC